MPNPIAKRNGVLATSWRKPPSRMAATNSIRTAAHRHLRRQATVQREILDAGIAAREQDLLRNHQAAGREQDQRAQFGDAVDREPSEKVDGELAVVVQCDASRRAAAPDRPMSMIVGIPAAMPSPNVMMPTIVLWLNSTLAKMPKASTAPGQGAKISLFRRSARVLDGPRPPASPDGTNDENQASSCTVSMKPAAVPTDKAERGDQDVPARRAHRRLAARARRTCASLRAGSPRGP